MRLLAGFRKHTKQDRRQYRNDNDDNKKLDRCEAFEPNARNESRLAHSLYLLLTNATPKNQTGC